MGAESVMNDNCRYLPLWGTVREWKMFTVTSTGRDGYGAKLIIITCQPCGYFEEHFTDRGLFKVGKMCDRRGISQTSLELPTRWQCHMLSH